MLFVLALAPAAATAATRPKSSHYTLTKAHGVVRVTYQGTEAAGCAARGLCGVSGTATYRFGGPPRSGEVDLIEVSRPFGFGAFGTQASTSSSVQTPGAAPCQDRVTHRADGFDLVRHSRTLMEFRFHTGVTESAASFLGTRCAGPRDGDVGLPLVKALLPLKVFRAPRLAFSVQGSRKFKRGGFEGLANWDLAFRMVGARCNPNCAQRRTPVSGR
ncbi:MAG: hypothetical protein QOE08_519 [Thermoleophilaceae bacterium]|nr:hypothetical protein [Thermoleophilaceae bacterium]